MGNNHLFYTREKKPCKMSCNDAETVGGNLWLSQLLFLLSFVPYIGGWCALANLYFFFVVAGDIACLVDAGSLQADGFAWFLGADAMIIWYVVLGLAVCLIIAMVLWFLSYFVVWIPFLGWFCWAFFWFIWYVLIWSNFFAQVWATLEMFLTVPAGLEPYTGPGVFPLLSLTCLKK